MATVAATKKQRRGHDPDGRRQQIVAATVRVIAEVGIERTTHRLIASRAGVPLGATTYYFPTLRDLVKTAIDRVILEAREYVGWWNDRLADSNDVPTTLVDLIGDYIGRRENALLEYDLYLAAARNPQLRPLADVWRDEVPRMLELHMSVTCAKAVSILLNGVMFEAVVSGVGFDRVLLRRALNTLVNDLDGGDIKSEVPFSPFAQ